jgi:hypothetical protein
MRGDAVSPTAPTVADVERIAALSDPVVRNLQITQCYSELSRALAARLDGAPANWCMFATWASKQAGQTIRREDLARAFERLFNQSPEGTDAGRTAVASIAEFRAGRDRERAIDLAAFASFRESLQPGDPPDGQGRLRQAFTAYAAALHEGDRKTRAQLMLLANLAIGFHEQTRLQPQIAEALDAPFEEPVKLRRDLLARLLNLHAGVAFRLALELVPGRATSLTEVLDDLDRLVKQIAHEAITELLMTLTLPGEVLRLGRDVPGAFPVGLEAIDNPDLSALLGSTDPTRDSTRGSGAEDWSMLAERIHFIADFFRVYQERPTLLSDPFTAEQATVIKSGGRPPGRL